MKAFKDVFNSHNDRKVIKWSHYLDIYEKLFIPFKDKEIKLLELGVMYGGSLQLFKKYFEKGHIYGIDIYKECLGYQEPRIQIDIGSSNDKPFLTNFAKLNGNFDIIIDDASHRMSHQINAFETLFPFLNSGGIMIIEDVHTSYWLDYGGGYKRKGTFIEYSKNLIDLLNSQYSQQSSFKTNYYSSNIFSLTFYDSIVVIEKSIRKLDSYTMERGDIKVEPRQSINHKIKTSIWFPFALKVVRLFEKILQYLKLKSLFFK